MAIKGTFIADFEQFKAATQSATKTLQDFEAQSVHVETALKEMSQAAPTGLGKVNESAKQANSSLLTMGRTAAQIAGAFGIVFSAQAVVNFGRELLATAQELEKLHQRTGLSVQALQTFKVAGDAAGNTLEQLARASTSLQDRLAAGDKSAVQAVKDLGLSLDALRTMGAEDQLIAISDAIRQVSASGERIRYMNDLIRNGAEILPTMARGFDDVKNSAAGMSGAAVAALDRLGNTVTSLGRGFRDAIGEFVGGTVVRGFEKFWQDAQALISSTGISLETLATQATTAGEAMNKVVPPTLPRALDDVKVGLDAITEIWNRHAAAADRAKTAIENMIFSQQRFIDLALPAPKDITFGTGPGETPFEPTGAFKQVLQGESDLRQWREDVARANEEMTTGLHIVQDLTGSVTTFGETGVTEFGKVKEGMQEVTEAAGQVRGAIEGMIPKDFDWAQAYKDAGLFVQSSPFLGTSLLSQQNRNLSSLQALTVNSNVNVSGVFDTNAQEALRSAVSDSVTRAVLQGRKVAA